MADLGRKAKRALRKDLSTKTGLKLKTKNGFLVNKTDRKGNVKRNNSAQTSESASETLNAAISGPETVFLRPGNDGSNSPEGSNIINLDSHQLSIFQGETSEGLDNTTMGSALTFFHEFFHTEAGGNSPDEENSRIAGPTTVDRTNKIRRELGSSFGQRQNYFGEVLNFGNGRTVGTTNPRVIPKRTRRNERRIRKGTLELKYKY